MITLYTAVTLDGYIATTDGSVDFLENPRYQLPDEDMGTPGSTKALMWWPWATIRTSK